VRAGRCEYLQVEWEAMEEADVSAQQSATELIPPVCGECGYRLQGLPVEGTCPECGTAYQTDRVVIAGWGADVEESVSNAAPDRLRFVLLSSVFVFLLNAVIRLIKGHPGEAIISLCGALIIAGIELFNRWRLHESAELPCHAKLFPEGFGQRNGFGKCSLNPWSTVGKLILEPVSKGRHRLQITSRTVLGVPVSIEFECSSQQAAWLREIITRFRTAAR